MARTPRSVPEAKNSEEIAAVEKFLVETQFRLHQLMEKKNMSRKNLAEELGVSKARVSQLFGDRPNITLETLARIFFALQEPSGRVTSDTIQEILGELERELAVENMRAWKQNINWTYGVDASNNNGLAEQRNVDRWREIASVALQSVDRATPETSALRNYDYEDEDEMTLATELVA